MELTQERSWNRALAEAVRDPDELVDLLALPEKFREGARRAAQRFPLVVPRGFVARMHRGDPHDPLLRQVLPLGDELGEVEGVVADPVQDGEAERAPGLLQKYRGRALLVTTGSCAVNCRYCFRRHYPYGEVPRGEEAWQPALDAIRSDRTLREVILSGGDPLILSDESLRRLIELLSTIGHLTRLRIHTRLPIVLPERITDGLLDTLRNTRLTSIVVVHANHAAELAGTCSAALGRLIDSGLPVFNQAVLLRGVNDAIESLVELCERCIDLRVSPYYLHQLDPVQGAAHFHVDPQRGRDLVQSLRERLPGYAVPEYVKEVPGATGKVAL